MLPLVLLEVPEFSVACVRRLEAPLREFTSLNKLKQSMPSMPSMPGMAYPETAQCNRRTQTNQVIRCEKTLSQLTTELYFDSTSHITMSKKVGLSAFTNSESALKQYQQLGKTLFEQQHEKLAVQLSVFQQALANFAKNHPDEIKGNEKFRSEFTKMCLSVGVDPLAASLSKKPSSSGSTTVSGTSTTNNKKKGKIKSLWSKLLEDNNEEFYNELAVKVIEVCKQYQDLNGGITSIDEILKTLGDPNSPNSILDLDETDIEKTVSLLQTLDDNFAIITIGNKKFVRSIPQELNKDQSTILEVCEIMGYTSVLLLVANYRWSQYRAQDVLQSMVSSGFLWVDDQTEENEIHYWEPSWINQSIV